MRLIFSLLLIIITFLQATAQPPPLLTVRSLLETGQRYLDNNEFELARRQFQQALSQNDITETERERAKELLRETDRREKKYLKESKIRDDLLRRRAKLLRIRESADFSEAADIYPGDATQDPLSAVGQEAFTFRLGVEAEIELANGRQDNALRLARLSVRYASKNRVGYARSVYAKVLRATAGASRFLSNRLREIYAIEDAAIYLVNDSILSLNPATGTTTLLATGASAILYANQKEVVYRGQNDLWRYREGWAKPRQLTAHTDRPICIETIADGQMYSSGRDGKVVFWGSVDQPINEWQNGEAPVYQILAQNGITWTRAADGNIRSARNGKIVSTINEATMGYPYHIYKTEEALLIPTSKGNVIRIDPVSGEYSSIAITYQPLVALFPVSEEHFVTLDLDGRLHYSDGRKIIGDGLQTEGKIVAVDAVAGNTQIVAVTDDGYVYWWTPSEGSQKKSEKLAFVPVGVSPTGGGADCLVKGTAGERSFLDESNGEILDAWRGSTASYFAPLVVESGRYVVDVDVASRRINYWPTAGLFYSESLKSSPPEVGLSDEFLRVFELASGLEKYQPRSHW